MEREKFIEKFNRAEDIYSEERFNNVLQNHIKVSDMQLDMLPSDNDKQIIIMNNLSKIIQGISKYLRNTRPSIDVSDSLICDYIDEPFFDINRKNRFFENNDLFVKYRGLKKSDTVYSGTYNMIVAIEELSELIQEIVNYINYGGDKIGMIEELADVTICMEMIRHVMGIDSTDIAKAINVKLDRIADRNIKELEMIKKNSIEENNHGVNNNEK